MVVPNVTVNDACIANTVVKGAPNIVIAHCIDIFPNDNKQPPTNAKSINDNDDEDDESSWSSGSSSSSESSIIKTEISSGMEDDTAYDNA